MQLKITHNKKELNRNQLLLQLAYFVSSVPGFDPGEAAVGHRVDQKVDPEDEKVDGHSREQTARGLSVHILQRRPVPGGRQQSEFYNMFLSPLK